MRLTPSCNFRICSWARTSLVLVDRHSLLACPAVLLSVSQQVPGASWHQAFHAGLLPFACFWESHDSLCPCFVSQAARIVAPVGARLPCAYLLVCELFLPGPDTEQAAGEPCAWVFVWVNSCFPWLGCVLRSRITELWVNPVVSILRFTRLSWLPRCFPFPPVHCEGSSCPLNCVRERALA